MGVAIMLSYSPPSTLHPQVTYTIVFSAGLNVLQVDYVAGENDKETFLYTPSSLYCSWSVVQVCMA